MPTSHRTERIASLIRSEISRVLIADVSDPRLKDISITEVQLTGDLRLAKVYYFSHSELTGQREKELRRGLDRATPYFKRKIQEHLDLRYIPNLEFELDEHTGSALRVGNLIEHLGSK